MRNRLVLCFLILSSVAKADRLNPGDWIGSAGIGFLSPPGMFLISPHLEKVYKKNIFLGALVQAGFGGSGALFTISATGRLQMGIHPRLRPTMEAGLGMSSATNGIGFLFHLGMGVDYLLEADLAISTVVRACFAPPIQSFFLSWPIVQLRYLF
jgi:hypothetical protein